MWFLKSSLATLVGILTLLLSVSHSQVQSPSSSAAAPPGSMSEGILRSIENARVDNARVADANGVVLLSRVDRSKPIELAFVPCRGVGVQRDHDAWWVLPLGGPSASIVVNSGLWVLPMDAFSQDASWHLDVRGSEIRATQTADGLKVQLSADSVTLRRAEASPHSDVFGNRFAIEMQGSRVLEEALASFYWGTMLPSVVERTMAATFPYSSGYVLSTLQTSQYAGTYPAVDHEFQTLGRLAFGSSFDLDLVRRMIELQFRIMDDDPERLSRMPTSVQPDGRREYHVRRDSMDRRENAAMFPLTGNIEVLQEAWHWYEATGDGVWLAGHIENLERAAAWVLANTDQYNRVWSDVYYEDQVIKDGRVTQAQAFAAVALRELSQMEMLLKRKAQANEFRERSKKIAMALVTPVPLGYWDEERHRFVDWVDRNGRVHDHVHLLANTLPVTLGFATAEQSASVRQLIEANHEEFERFPSFLAAHIDSYTKSEIGIAGPYDLSAAGRYWYWDAAYRVSQNQNAILVQQLRAVAAEAAKTHGFMGERYDMDHVYYVDGKDAHGAEQYYEYPNVFAAVLISKYLGLGGRGDTEVSVAPHLAKYGSVQFDVAAYALQYRWDSSGFTLTNLSRKSRRFTVDLSGLSAGGAHFLQQHVSEGKGNNHVFVITLGPRQGVHWGLAVGPGV